MAQPVPYTRSNDFDALRAAGVGGLFPANLVNVELDAITICLEEIIDNLAIIQRDDTQVANMSIGRDQLKNDILVGISAPTTWVTGHAYAVNDCVVNGSAIYRCLVAHTSGTFSTDLGAGKWTLVLDADNGALGSRTISTTGLMTGGGTLAADRVFDVPKASGAEASTGTNDAKAVTPLALATPLALKAQLAGGNNFTGSQKITQTGSTIAALHIQSAAGTISRLNLDTASTVRWALRKNSTAESGTNAGSNFEIARCDDAGTEIDVPLTITRSTGVASFASRPTFGGDQMVVRSDGPIRTADDPDFALPTDGTTNCASALNAAIAALADGSTLNGLGRTFKCNSQIVVGATKKRITLENMVLDFSGAPDGTICLLAEGTLAANLPVTETLSVDEQAITVTTSTSTLTEGDWVWVHSDEDWDPNHHFVKFGEWHQVAEVQNSTTFAIVGNILYEMVTNTGVRKLTPVENLTLRRIRLIGNGLGVSGTSQGIKLHYCANALLDMVEVERFDTLAIRFDACVNCTVRGGNIGKGRGALGYGISMVNGCMGSTIHGVSFYYLLQAIDLGNNDNEGPNRFTTVTDCKFFYMKANAISAHSSADHTIFAGNHVWCDPLVTGSNGVLMRGINATIKNNRIHTPNAEGIKIYTYVTGATGKGLIEGNSVTHCRGESGILVRTADTDGGGLTQVGISGNQVSGANGANTYGIYVLLDDGDMGQVSVIGNQVKDFEEGVFVDLNSTNVIKGLTVSLNTLDCNDGGIGVHITAATDGACERTIITGNNAYSNGGTLLKGLLASGEENLVNQGNVWRGATTPTTVTATNKLESNLT